VQVFENDGQGTFTLREIDRGKECHLGMRLWDLDGDGDLDIVGHAWDNYELLHLWQNDGPWPRRPGAASSRASLVVASAPAPGGRGE
jgi:hypothetical protein